MSIIKRFGRVSERAREREREIEVEKERERKDILIDNGCSNTYACIETPIRHGYDTTRHDTTRYDTIYREIDAGCVVEKKSDSREIV